MNNVFINAIIKKNSEVSDMKKVMLLLPLIGGLMVTLVMIFVVIRVIKSMRRSNQLTDSMNDLLQQGGKIGNMEGFADLGRRADNLSANVSDLTGIEIPKVGDFAGAMKLQDQIMDKVEEALEKEKEIQRKINESPVEHEHAKVIGKRASYHNNLTSYYTTFEFDDGQRMECRLSGQQYGLLVEGDRGMLEHQYIRFISFEREHS